MKPTDIKRLEKALAKYREIAELLLKVKDSAYESGETVSSGGMSPHSVQVSSLIRDMLRNAVEERQNLERKIKLFSDNN